MSFDPLSSAVIFEKIYRYSQVITQQRLNEFVDFAASIGNRYYLDGIAAWQRAEEHWNNGNNELAYIQFNIARDRLPHARNFFAEALTRENSRWLKFIPARKNKKAILAHVYLDTLEKLILIYHGIGISETAHDEIKIARSVHLGCPHYTSQCGECWSICSNINNIATNILEYECSPIEKYYPPEPSWGDDPLRGMTADERIRDSW